METHKNPEHQLAPEVVEALSSRQAAHLNMLALRNESDLTPGIRNRLLEARQNSYRASESIGLADRLGTGLRNVVTEQNSHIADTLKRRVRTWKELGIARSDLVFSKPINTDHTFWWAQTQPFLAPNTTAQFRDDGLHFFGGPKLDEYNGEMHTSFGARALFKLNSERLPRSATGSFMSSPHVELFGGVVAYGPNWDLLQGHGIAECNLVLRQSIFQLPIGPTGAVTVPVAEATSNDSWRIYLRDTGHSRHLDLPGFKSMPLVGFHQSQFRSNFDLWAELEVCFDIYLNTAGALLWCEPEVLLRTFQWPLAPAP